MPVFGIGLHILIAIFFAIHAVRTKRELYWLLILFSFPLLGSIVYFVVIYLPDTRIQHGVRKATSVAMSVLDPSRELREAEQAFDLTPTAQNQMRLANALLEAGEIEKAVQNFDLCLRGPFAKDAEIQLVAAKAKLKNNQAEAALDLLLAIRAQNQDFRPEQLGLLLAQSYAALGRFEDARAEFSALAARFGSIDVLGEYAIWAASIGDSATVNQLKAEIAQIQKHWTKHARTINAPLLKRLEAALSMLAK